MITVLFAQVADSESTGGLHFSQSTIQLFIVFGAIAVVVLAALWFLVSFRRRWAGYKHLRKHRRHRHHRHHDSENQGEVVPAANTAGQPPELQRQRHHRHRKRRRPHRPINPTLAQTGGLPPKRDGDTPPHSPPSPSPAGPLPAASSPPAA